MYTWNNNPVLKSCSETLTLALKLDFKTSSLFEAQPGLKNLIGHHVLKC